MYYLDEKNGFEINPLNYLKEITFVESSNFYKTIH